MDNEIPLATDTRGNLEALCLALNTFNAAAGDMLQAFIDALPIVTTRVEVSLNDDAGDAPLRKLSHKQLTKLTPAERVEYAREIGKQKGKHRGAIR